MSERYPEYSQIEFVKVTPPEGEATIIPAHSFDEDEFPDGSKVETFRGKWFGRLYGRGYTMPTAWAGPFDSEAEAKTHIQESHNVDPVSGEPF
jgi:hypothetical protein